MTLATCSSAAQPSIARVPEVIVVLGARNAADGTLTEGALARVQTTLAEAEVHPEAGVVVTGGRGMSFNLSAKPHVSWLAQALLAGGLAPGRLLAAVFSRHTVEDAVLLRDLLPRPNVWAVVTSSYHRPRAEFIFRCFFGGVEPRWIEAPDALPHDELVAAERHEARSLATLQAQGGVIHEGRLFPSSRPVDLRR